MKRAIMQIIIHSDRDEDYLAFKKDLHIILEHGVTDFSLSPLRTDTMKTGYGEMYMTLSVNNVSELLHFLATSWSGPEDDCETDTIQADCFHPLVSYLNFQLPDV